MGAALPLGEDFDAAPLRGLAQRSRDGAQTRRLLALAVIYDGHRRSDAARFAGVGLQIIRDRVLRFNAEGPDGMAAFFVDGRTVLAVNNEYVNLSIIYGNRASGLPENADDVRKGKAGHGVSVFEVEMKDGAWRAVVDSPFNRRITADTPMEITGPARGHDMLKTAADPTGAAALGTWNNCGNGETPWGACLACEENFQKEGSKRWNRSTSRPLASAAA